MTIPDYKLNGKWAYSKRVNGKRIMTFSASLWYNMKRRCNGGPDNPTYSNCTISDEFSDFQKFADWHVRQIGYGLGYHLDKDLFSGEVKTYSSETCVLIPQRLNNFMCEMGSRRGEYPMGVSKYRDKFASHIRVDNESKYLGLFTCPEDAHKAYIIAKTEHARTLSLELVGKVDFKVIEKLLNYSIKTNNPRRN